jgi:hypothetical protein
VVSQKKYYPITFQPSLFTQSIHPVKKFDRIFSAVKVRQNGTGVSPEAERLGLPINYIANLNEKIHIPGPIPISINNPQQKQRLPCIYYATVQIPDCHYVSNKWLRRARQWIGPSVQLGKDLICQNPWSRNLGK